MAYRQLPAGPQAQVTGDVSLEEFRANTLAPSEDLLAWKALNLRGFHVALDPGKATRVEVKETVLSDFFARVIAHARRPHQPAGPGQIEGGGGGRRHGERSRRAEHPPLLRQRKQLPPMQKARRLRRPCRPS